MEDLSLAESLKYIAFVNDVAEKISDTFNLVCTCVVCDKMEFVSLLYEDKIEMPIWFAEMLARKVAA